MAAKRGPSAELIPNPFIKKRNLEWTIELPATATAAVAAAAVTASSSSSSSSSSSGASSPEDQQQGEGANDNNDNDNDIAVEDETYKKKEDGGLSAAAVEAGEARVDDHLDYFSQILTKATLAPFPPDNAPHLAVARYRELYGASFGSSRGAHFVVHQHDHPVAGAHYDLRLQINETSSASWAIMYGLPGDPNSKRLNRNATETRVHCLWNHLIETASPATGSLLIWDTGTYTVLPSKDNSDNSNRPAVDPNSQQSPHSPSPPPDPGSGPTEQAKLQRAFEARKIRIQLHGTRLPHAYALNLRLTQNEEIAGRARSLRGPATKRRRRQPQRRGRGKVMTSSSSDSDDDDNDEADTVKTPPGKGGGGGEEEEEEDISTMEREIRELEDEQVRRTNAYPGAANTIGSVHQRRWYASLDREACGFVRHRRGGRVVWEPSTSSSGGATGSSSSNSRCGGAPGDGDAGRLSFPFYVRGVEVERSVVTGRLGADVLRDEGVVGYVSRKGWRPVLN